MAKILHQIWLGPHEMPPLFQEWAAGWKAQYHAWEYRLWTDTEAGSFPLYRKLAPLCTDWATRCDLLRLIIIAAFGGLYVDVDMQSIKPMGHLLEPHDFVLGGFTEEWNTPEQPWEWAAGNGLIYAKKNSPQAQAAVAILERGGFRSIVGGMIAGDWLLQVARSNGGVFLLNHLIHCPVAPWEDLPAQIDDQTHCIHHWEGSWLSEKNRASLKLRPRKITTDNAQF